MIQEVEKKSARKIIISKGVVKKFAPRLKKFDDVVMEEGDALIEDAYTIDVRAYREGLKDLIGREHFVEKVVEDLSQVEGWKVLALGYGVKELLNLPNLMYRKGQQYIGQKKVAPSKYGSIVGRGHVSFLGGDKVCLGSTYETDFEDDSVDEAFAEYEICKKMEPWYAPLGDVVDKEFVSGVRVGQDTTYLPLVEEVAEKTLVFTGLGSRGLLYHAYYGKIVADKVVLGDGE